MHLDSYIKTAFKYVALACLCISTSLTSSLENPIPKDSSPKYFTQNELDSDKLDSSDSSKNHSHNASAMDSALESKTLNKITARAGGDTTSANTLYQSNAGNISRDMIESNPSGNGDITSLLRILPNVQYDIAQQRSASPGVIDPAKICISGGLHYQNLFMIDGMGMNNDLDPAGGLSSVDSWAKTNGNSQGFAIDTSLLESINVQDSNVSAAYGGFTGGVVEANTRRPTKKFGAKISYQITQGDIREGKVSMTNYHIYGDDTDLQDFINSTSESNQPIFQKHIVRANIESKLNDKFGFLASFSTIQSFIPLHTGSSYTTSNPFEPANQSTNKQDQRRQSYNLFVKTYYDMSEELRFELTYLYAPQFNRLFTMGTRDDFSSIDSGGHQIGFKTTWENALGTLTNTLNYSYMESSTRGTYDATKYWYLSESKNWARFNVFAREGGALPYHQNQHTINNKLIQDFTPFEVLKMTHRFQIGLELGYQYADFSMNKDYSYAYNNGNTTAMTQDQMNACIALGDYSWCDPYRAYNGSTYLEYGQYIRKMYRYHAGSIHVNNVLGAVFVEDSIRIPLSKFGAINVRPGVRVEADSYMGKVTAGYRFSLNYEFPWNTWEKGKNFPTQITMGVNRYYGRNIFAYALQDGISSMQTLFIRQDPNTSWDSILTNGVTCVGSTARPDRPDLNYDQTCSMRYSKDTKFSRLNVPYVNEYMVGFAQNIYDWNLGIKYIHRQGKDEIRRMSSSVGNLPSDSNYASTYYTYTNEGKSTTNVITISLQNNIPLEILGVKNFILFAFDWTNVRRNYTDYSTDVSNAEILNQWISWNGQIIRYADKPADNFVRPYTIRLSTTHTFNLWRTKWTWNNFFRYRSSYTAMAATLATSTRPTNPPDKIDTNGDGILDTAVDTFRPFNVKGAFTWDMRIGFEVNIHKGNTLFINLDIYNVLDSKNLAIASASYSTTAGTTATPIYEVGRQFWLEVGYKF